eukprot:14730820-Alexandrium_andersonii.AAC.1
MSHRRGGELERNRCGWSRVAHGSGSLSRVSWGERGSGPSLRGDRGIGGARGLRLPFEAPCG